MIENCFKNLIASFSTNTASWFYGLSNFNPLFDKKGIKTSKGYNLPLSKNQIPIKHYYVKLYNNM